MQYRHPLNGHIETAGGGSSIGFALAGPLFLLFRGVMAPALGWFVLGVVVAAVAWPLLLVWWIAGIACAPMHVRQHLLRQGYSVVEDPRAGPDGQPAPATNLNSRLLKDIAILAVISVVLIAGVVAAGSVKQWWERRGDVAFTG